MKKIILISVIFLSISWFAKSQTMRYFEFTTGCGSGNWLDTSFVAAASDQAIIDTVLANIALPLNQRKFINGNITSGNGGCNHNASHWFLWHFIPDQWNLVYVAVELCDGCPAGFDMHPAILAGDTLQFCPWTGKPVKEVSNPSGISKPNSENEILLYPNPAYNVLHIQNNSTQLVLFTLYNPLGEKLIDQIVANKTSTINLSAYANGIYFYNLSYDKERIKSGKIIKL